MAEVPYLKKATGVFTGLIGSTDVQAGDALYFDGTDWERADADVHTTPAQTFAVHAYDTAETNAPLCTGGILVDVDAPYTAKDTLYLSAPGGTPVAQNITSTMPTGDGNLRQVVGFALSTSEIRLNIAVPRLVTQFIPSAVANTTGEAATNNHLIDAGWTGPQIDAAGETSYIGPSSLPYDFLSLVEAHLMFSNIGGSAALDYDFTIVGAYDGASNVQDTGTAITAADIVGTPPVDDFLEYFNVAAVFDAAFATPGRNWEMLLDPDGVGSADQLFTGVRLVMLVAN